MLFDNEVSENIHIDFQIGKLLAYSSSTIFTSDVSSKDISDAFRMKNIDEIKLLNHPLKNCLTEKSLPQKAIYLFLIPQEHNSKEVMELYREME